MSTGLLGGLRPCCGHVRDTQSLGVCRGFQEGVYILECVGRCGQSYAIFITKLFYKLIMMLIHTQLFDHSNFFFDGRLITQGAWSTRERSTQRDWRRTLPQTLWVRRVTCRYADISI